MMMGNCRRKYSVYRGITKKIMLKIITLTMEQGYVFTEEDLKAFEEELLALLKGIGELSEEEMKLVASGN